MNLVKQYDKKLNEEAFLLLTSQVKIKLIALLGYIFVQASKVINQDTLKVLAN